MSATFLSNVYKLFFIFYTFYVFFKLFLNFYLNVYYIYDLIGAPWLVTAYEPRDGCFKLSVQTIHHIHSFIMLMMLILVLWASGLPFYSLAATDNNYTTGAACSGAESAENRDA